MNLEVEEAIDVGRAAVQTELAGKSKPPKRAVLRCVLAELTTVVPT
jgi:hypothetical protein